MELNRFSGQAALNSALAGEVAKRLANAIMESGRASIAVSGGRTPVGFFNKLSSFAIDWPRVLITLVDERWVPPEHPDSNERLVREHLLKKRARVARFIGLKGPCESVEQGESWCEGRLREALPFTCVVLGMGLDGHTASLFPGASGLQDATRARDTGLCKAIIPQDAPHQRITLTLRAILSTGHIFIHIIGDRKRAVLEKAFGPGPCDLMPIRFVLRQEGVPVSVYWAP